MLQYMCEQPHHLLSTVTVLRSEQNVGRQDNHTRDELCDSRVAHDTQLPAEQLSCTAPTVAYRSYAYLEAMFY